MSKTPFKDQIMLPGTVRAEGEREEARKAGLAHAQALLEKKQQMLADVLHGKPLPRYFVVSGAIGFEIKLRIERLHDDGTVDLFLQTDKVPLKALRDSVLWCDNGELSFEGTQELK